MGVAARLANSWAWDEMYSAWVWIGGVCEVLTCLPICSGCSGDRFGGDDRDLLEALEWASRGRVSGKKGVVSSPGDMGVFLWSDLLLG